MRLILINIRFGDKVYLAKPKFNLGVTPLKSAVGLCHTSPRSLCSLWAFLFNPLRKQVCFLISISDRDRKIYIFAQNTAMTLIKSISGIRGTIGGEQGNNLTPYDIVKFSVGYGTWIKETAAKPKVVIGRDARISGSLVSNIVSSVLISMGIDVIDLGLSTTPTVEMAVTHEKANGGIILTASHNPKQWNALKLLNEKGEFLSAEAGEKVLAFSETDDTVFSEVDDLGKHIIETNYFKKHVQWVLDYPLVNKELIEKANFSVVVDGVNSSGGVFVPELLEALGVKKIKTLNAEPTGIFAHNPEPLPEHLTEISDTIKSEGYDVGVVVDPDVDRLALVCEDGSMFGEEYTLVAVADYILSKKKGNTVSNLSSTRALRDVTESYDCDYNASAVGEVNVVKLMKSTNAVIGGEGNGGIIVPDFHYGRDALIGIALFLTHLAEKKCSVTELRKSYPSYFISKNKIQLVDGMNPDDVLKMMHEKYASEKVSTIDGVKIELNDIEWVHLRKSNTEPIVRVYCESTSEESSKKLGERFVAEMKALM